MPSRIAQSRPQPVAHEPAGLDVGVAVGLEPQRIARERADEILDEARLHAGLASGDGGRGVGDACHRSSTQRRCQSWNMNSVHSCLR